MVLWTSLSKFHEEEIYLNPQLAKIHIVQCENIGKSNIKEIIVYCVFINIIPAIQNILSPSHKHFYRPSISQFSTNFCISVKVYWRCLMIGNNKNVLG